MGFRFCGFGYVELLIDLLAFWFVFKVVSWQTSCFRIVYYSLCFERF